MPGTTLHRSSIVNLVMVAVVVLCVALATPWAAGFRAHVWPSVAILVVVLGSLSGVAEVVHGLVTLLSEREGLRASAYSLCFGASGILLALTFLPAAAGAPPRTVTLCASAVCSILAAVLQRRSSLRSKP